MKYRFKTKPFKHQVKALRHVLRGRGGALFMEMRTGKTKVAIDWACALQHLEGVERVLVVCPLSVIGVWDREIDKHANPPRGLSWWILNYDQVLRNREFKTLQKWKPDAIILDESQKVKNPNAARSRALHSLGRSCQFRLILTGTSITKNHLDLYSQFKFLAPEVFGTRWRPFREEYALWGGYLDKKMIRPLNLKKLRKKIKPHIYQVTRAEVFDEMPVTEQIIPMDLQESRGLYEEMANEAIIEIAGEEIAAPVIVTKLLRLRQMTGGWVRGEGDYVRVGEETKRVFTDWLRLQREGGLYKFVVFTPFKRELVDVAHVVSAMGYQRIMFHGGVDRSVRDLKICQFEETEKPTAFICQIATGALGISLVAADTAFYYAHDDNYENFRHSRDRLMGPLQQRPVGYYHLMARNTIDEAVWLSLRTKRSLSDLVLRHPELVVGNSRGD